MPVAVCAFRSKESVLEKRTSTSPLPLFIEKNVSRRGHQVDIVQLWLKNLRVSADGAKIELAGALRANQRAAGGLDDNVARNFLQMDVAGIAFELHVAYDLLDVDEARLGLELKFGFFRNGELQIGFKFQRPGRCVQHVGSNVDAVSHLLDIETNFVGSLRADDIDFGILPGLDVDAAIGHVVDYDDGASGYAELLFNALSSASGAGGRGAPK